MKTKFYVLGTLAIILSLLPNLVLIVDNTIIFEKLDVIKNALGGLMFVSILLVLFGAEEKAFTVKKISFYTVPLLAIIFIFEIILLFITNTSFFKENFEVFVSEIGAIIFAVVIYAIFGGEYRLYSEK